MRFIAHEGLKPRKAHKSDAAFDLEAITSTRIHLQNGERAVVPCGFAIRIPEDSVGLVCSRSGLAANHGVFVLNAPGVIDPGYRGEVKVVLMNLGRGEFVIAPGDRIAQLLILRNEHVEFYNRPGLWLEQTERAGAGFGSTGTGGQMVPDVLIEKGFPPAPPMPGTQPIIRRFEEDGA